MSNSDEVHLHSGELQKLLAHSRTMEFYLLINDLMLAPAAESMVWLHNFVRRFELLLDTIRTSPAF
ncbi:hypothetical protein RchiOBHm_Chr1g0321221 [Rosa chinensis]|uniref:Uncharacterized protein n=1 Tax=Rosa chinensis TaxID=74649 RepID=A0A2P6S912_ROSCH|nr:hypothetical protein RchiOBHm_Chr1g0321221 [Rosa chinensis]